MNILSLAIQILLLQAFPSPGAASVTAVNVCVDCHKTLKAAMRDPVKKWETSIHKTAGVTCVDCHGGDSSSKEFAMEKVSGFTGAPLRDEIPELCAGCHSDIRKMRKYNLRTDQFSLYKTSAHGVRLYTEDDDNVATCVDCHNSHDIFSKNNPKSPVYRFNIPKTCNKCHGDEEIMADYNTPLNQLELYKQSVHGRKLFKEQNLMVPTCIDCHGNHGAAPFGIPNAASACRTCHSGIFEYFRKSPHANPGKGGNRISCVQCHGNHKIDKPSLSKFSDEGKKNCLSCHPENSSEFNTGLAIKRKIERALVSVSEAKDSFDALKNTRGAVFDAEAMEGVIKKAETLLSGTIPVAHSLNSETVGKNTDKVMELSVSMSDEIQAKFSELNFRKIFLFISWLFIIIAITLFKKLIGSLS